MDTVEPIATSSQDGVDEQGTPKISVNIDVPSIAVTLQAG